MDVTTIGVSLIMEVMIDRERHQYTKAEEKFSLQLNREEAAGVLVKCQTTTIKPSTQVATLSNKL